MAIDTLESLNFVNHYSCSVLVFHFMAGAAVYFCVATFQGESGGVMVKLFRNPAFCDMASRTFRDTVDSKFVVMNILVAGDTSSFQRIKLLGGGGAVFRNGEMAIAAIYPGMPAIERPARLIMIKIDKIPGIVAVAGFTSIFRIILLTDVAVMNIFMTVYTLATKVAETPAIGTFIHMTGKARCSEMRPFQRKG